MGQHLKSRQFLLVQKQENRTSCAVRRAKLALGTATGSITTDQQGPQEKPTWQSHGFHNNSNRHHPPAAATRFRSNTTCRSVRHLQPHTVLLAIVPKCTSQPTHGKQHHQQQQQQHQSLVHNHKAASTMESIESVAAVVTSHTATH